ncbi:hypothetical protein QTP88_008893 [Uroleucon formosanum]
MAHAAEHNKKPTRAISRQINTMSTEFIIHRVRICTCEVPMFVPILYGIKILCSLSIILILIPRYQSQNHWCLVRDLNVINIMTIGKCSYYLLDCREIDINVADIIEYFQKLKNLSQLSLIV